MESRAKLLGHPIHQQLIVIPLGTLIAAVIFDALYLWLGNTTFASVAFWNIAVGILGGLFAAVFGLVDWLAIPARTRAKRIGAMHGLTNVVVIGLFTFAWLTRLAAGEPIPSMTIFLVELAAIALSAVAGWLGGELVDRLGVGVDTGAHLNAPNSLSRRNALGTDRDVVGAPPRL